METIVYCENCLVVPLPLGHVELCTGCINDIVAWLEQEDLARHIETQIEEVTYQKQFTL